METQIWVKDEHFQLYILTRYAWYMLKLFNWIWTRKFFCSKWKFVSRSFFVLHIVIISFTFSYTLLNSICRLKHFVMIEYSNVWSILHIYGTEHNRKYEKKSTRQVHKFLWTHDETSLITFLFALLFSYAYLWNKNCRIAKSKPTVTVQTEIILHTQYFMSFESRAWRFISVSK